MLKGRKLTEDEVTQLVIKEAKQTGKSRLLQQQLYDSLVAEFVAGEYGEVTLGVDEKKLTVRKHMKAAFDRKGLTVTWHRAKADTLRFQVSEPNPAYGDGH